MRRAPFRCLEARALKRRSNIRSPQQRQIFRPSRAPLPPITEPDALRLAVRLQMAIWEFGVRRISAAQPGLMSGSITRWLGADPAFSPSDAWLAQVREGTIAVVQEESRQHLAAWDPEGYGAWAERQTVERERKLAELEERLAAARSVA